eukprot:8411433-Pyramimonas_sp.AAC.1
MACFSSRVTPSPSAPYFSSRQLGRRRLERVASLLSRRPARPGPSDAGPVLEELEVRCRRVARFSS